MRPTAGIYGVTFAAVVVAALIRWLLDPLLGDYVPYPTFFVAVVFAVWVGGWRPALFATGLGFLLALFLFVPPRYSFLGAHGPHLLGLAMYVMVSLAIAVFGEAMRVAQRRSLQAERFAQQQSELLRITLASIGDAVITTDARGNVTYLNAVAEGLTGWTQDDAHGQPLVKVFHIINEQTRQSVESPVEKVLQHGQVVGLANHTILISKDGQERAIDDSAAPIRDDQRQVIGVVLVFHDITERRGLEREQQDAQAQLVTTLESITDGFVRFDRDWRVVYLNAHAELIARRPRAESLGKTVWELWPDLVGTKVETEFRRAVAEQVTVELENYYEPFGRWYALKLFPTPDGGLTIYFQDITESKRAAEVLRRSEERFRRVFETQTIGMIEWDLESGLITAANEHFLQMVGYTREDVAAGRLNFRAMTPPEWMARNEEGVAELLRTGRAGAYEKEYLRKDGTRVPILIAGVRFENSDREGMSFIIDLTDRKRVEEDLRGSEARFRAAAEAVSSLVWTNNTSGRMAGEQPGWENFTGQKYEDYQGYGWSQAVHPEDAPSTIDAWKKAVAEESTFEFEHRVRRRDGEWRLCSIRAVPVADDSGAIREWVGVHTDITEERASMEALRRLTAELSEGDRRKDEFLATLAHELRNPLAPIRNGLQILRLAGDSKAAIEPVRVMMERQVGQMVHLVDDLLDVSRVSRGKIDLRKEPIELASVLNNAVETSRPLIEASGHKLTVSLPPMPVIVDGDQTRLVQVFANLLNNAAKYSERGGQIELTAERQGSDAVVSVKDTGVGIPPDMLPKVFDLFTQVDRSLEKSQGGLGIGLTLVKRLVEMHDGSVEARSEGHGQGSEFVVRLPVVLSASREAQPPSDDDAPASPAGRCRILIADDNVDSAITLALILKMMGNEVHTVHDGLQAVEAGETFQPDVVLLDIGMPKLNGYEAARRIRELSWGRQAVLIALTGWGQDEDRRHSEEAGFNHHLVKPVAPAALEKLLAELKSSNVRPTSSASSI